MAKKSDNGKKEKSIPVIVIIMGIFCPIILIIYFVTRYWSDVEKTVGPTLNSDYIDSLYSSNKANNKPSSHNTDHNTSYDTDPPEKKFIMTGGDGNVYESGGMFCDWSGNYVEWGKPFRDHRGNYVEWGYPFYDNRDYYVGWGEPFYDAANNYINPKG